MIQEIRDLEPNKALGPDGFSTHIYQAYWPIINKDLCRMIYLSQHKPNLGGPTNSSFLALIPKDSSPSSFNKFLPISLCNVSYKIITKIMANRIKNIMPKIISINQGGFARQRHIMINVILLWEAIHSNKKRKEKGMVIKIDMANKFDRVRHEFLFQVMQHFGIDKKLII